MCGICSKNITGEKKGVEGVGTDEIRLTEYC